jgi:hypothetical protein
VSGDPEVIAAEPERQTCPRRMQDFGPWDRSEGLDRWATGHGLVGQDRVALSCSFCGSLHPDRFMELVREGWIVGPTDKSYKAYLESPLTDDEKAAKRQQWMDRGAIARAVRDLGESDGKTPEQIQADLDAEWERQAPGWLHGAQSAKFYFQHLTAGQRDEFIELYNDGRMKVGIPGHLYVAPFFARRQPPEDVGTEQG